MKKHIAFVVALILGGSFGYGTGPVPESIIRISEESQAAVQSVESKLYELRSTPDSDTVGSLQSEMIDLVCRYLSHDDAEVRYSILDVLDHSVESVDLSLVEGCVLVPDGEEASAAFLRSVLDRSQLFHLDQASKQEVLRDCMNHGSVELWRGTVLHAAACAGSAVWDGVPGLQSEIEFAYNNRFSQAEQDRVSLEEMTTAYSLISGPGLGWDQRNSASERILGVDSLVLATKLENDKSFRAVVTTLLSIHCSRGRKPMCTALRDGIEASILDIELRAKTDSGDAAIAWWHDARVNYGRFSTVPAHEQSLEEKIEEAMNRTGATH